MSLKLHYSPGAFKHKAPYKICYCDSKSDSPYFAFIQLRPQEKDVNIYS